MNNLLPILVSLLVIGALPAWSYSRHWGFYPSSLMGAVLLVILLLTMTDRI